MSNQPSPLAPKDPLTIARDIHFLRSRPEIQRSILSTNDPNFAASRPEVQDRILDSINSPLPTNDLGAGERLRYSLPGNSADLIATIEQDFGPDTAMETSKGLAFRRSTNDKFQLLDEVGFTFGDVLDVAGEIPELVGGAIGGTLGFAGGAAFGLGFGGAPGAVAGGALGTAAGRAGRQLISDVFGVQRAEGVDAVTDILVSGVIGGGAEFGGVLVAKAAGKLLRPFAKTIPDESKQAISFFEEIFSVDPRKAAAIEKGFTEFGLTSTGIPTVSLTTFEGASSEPKLVAFPDLKPKSGPNLNFEGSLTVLVTSILASLSTCLLRAIAGARAALKLPSMTSTTS